MDIIPMLFYPLIATIIVAVLGAVVSFVVALKCSKGVATIVKAISGLLIIGGIIASIVCMSLYYSNEIEPSGYYEDVNTYAMLALVIVFAAVLVVSYFFLGKRHPENNDTRSLAYGAIALALSFALGYARLFRMPQGGSITFASLLPLLIYAYMFGIRRGIILGVIYGVLQAVQDPWIIHPLQFLLDYPLAFAAIGLGGVFKELELFKKAPIVAFLLGGVVAVIVRYFCHVSSGIFAFASYAEDGYTAVAWGFVYNTFALADMAIALALGGFLFVSRTFVTQVLDKIPVGGFRRKGATTIEEEKDDFNENEELVVKETLDTVDDKSTSSEE